MKSKLITKLPAFKSFKAAQDEDEDYIEHQRSLGFFVKTKVSQQFTVNLDEAVVEAKYYRGVVSMLMEASEDDSVVFLINSPGGRYNGLVALLEALKMTDATTCAVIIGECHSAASIFALHCDQVFVSDSAEMLCHQVSYAAGGKGSDVLSHVQHVAKISEKLMRSTYKNFLTEQEINEMLSGREIYLDSDEIKRRLDIKATAEEQEDQAQAEAIVENQDNLIGIVKDNVKANLNTSTEDNLDALLPKPKRKK